MVLPALLLVEVTGDVTAGSLHPPCTLNGYGVKVVFNQDRRSEILKLARHFLWLKAV